MGRSEEALELQDGSPLSAVLDHYAARYLQLAAMASSVGLARNRRFEARSAALAEGDEVALLPPVSGGSDLALKQSRQSRHYFALMREPIETLKLAAGFARPEDGALVSFEGVVRNHSLGRPVLWVDYEGYEPMALETIAAIGRELAERHQLGRIAIVHRLGRLQIGEVSVLILASAPHRQPAFQAVAEAIDRLKRSVPIWKKEGFRDGESWVPGEWDPSLLER